MAQTPTKDSQHLHGAQSPSSEKHTPQKTQAPSDLPFRRQYTDAGNTVTTIIDDRGQPIRLQYPPQPIPLNLNVNTNGGPRPQLGSPFQTQTKNTTHQDSGAHDQQQHPVVRASREPGRRDHYFNLNASWGPSPDRPTFAGGQQTGFGVQPHFSQMPPPGHWVPDSTTTTYQLAQQQAYQEAHREAYEKAYQEDYPHSNHTVSDPFVSPRVRRHQRGMSRTQLLRNDSSPPDYGNPHRGPRYINKAQSPPPIRDHPIFRTLAAQPLHLNPAHPALHTETEIPRPVLPPRPHLPPPGPHAHPFDPTSEIPRLPPPHTPTNPPLTLPAADRRLLSQALGAVAGDCDHEFVLLNSTTVFIQWACAVCGNVDWMTWECRRCRMKTCRGCNWKV